LKAFSLLGALSIGLVLTSGGSAFALDSGSDLLMKTTIQIASTNSDDVLNRTTADLRGVFQRYQPAVDSGSKIVKPLRVSGSASRPILQMSVEKCVLFVCETVDMDAEVVLKESGGPCKRNFTLVGDLSKSSDRLKDTYDSLNVAICYNTDATGAGKLDLVASAHQAPNYDTGIIQQQIFNLLQLQIKPMTKALNDALKANSVVH
jgi:hypothetical protein